MQLKTYLLLLSAMHHRHMTVSDGRRDTWAID
jgi:hypothetical protein